MSNAKAARRRTPNNCQFMRFVHLQGKEGRSATTASCTKPWSDEVYLSIGLAETHTVTFVNLMRKSGAWRSRGFEKKRTDSRLFASRATCTHKPACPPSTTYNPKLVAKSGRSNTLAAMRLSRIRAAPNDNLQALNINPLWHFTLAASSLKAIIRTKAEQQLRVINSSLASSRYATEDRRKHRTVTTPYATAFTMTICDILRARFSLPSLRAPGIASGLFRREAATMPGGHSARNQ